MHIFSFPKESTLLDVWVQFCGRADEKKNLLYPGAVAQGICQLHFPENDIVKRSISKQKSRRREGDLKTWRLVKDAVPSLCPPDTSCVGNASAVRPLREKRPRTATTDEAQLMQVADPDTSLTYPEINDPRVMYYYSLLHPPDQESVAVERISNRCFVDGCDMATRVGQADKPVNEKVHIFTFPPDVARREAWVKFCRRADEQGNLLHPASRPQGICHHHFTENDIIKTSMRKQGDLRNWRASLTALPTLFPAGKKQQQSFSPLRNEEEKVAEPVVLPQDVSQSECLQTIENDVPDQESQADFVQPSLQERLPSNCTAPRAEQSVRIKYDQVSACCFVAGCASRRSSHIPIKDRRQFFRFPDEHVNPSQRNAWVFFCNRSDKHGDLKQPKTQCICDLHFRPQDIIKFSQNAGQPLFDKPLKLWRLVETTIPQLNGPLPSCSIDIPEAPSELVYTVTANILRAKLSCQHYDSFLPLPEIATDEITLR